MISTWKLPRNLALLSLGFACIGSACTFDDDGTPPFGAPPVGDAEPESALAAPQDSFIAAELEPVSPPDLERPNSEFLASRQTRPSNLLVRGDAVFWVEGSTSKQTLHALDLSVGENISVLALERRPYASVLYEKTIFFASEGQSIITTHLGAANQDKLMDTDSDPLAIAVTDEHVYWVTASGCLNFGLMDGSSSREITCIDEMATALALTEAAVYWVTAEGSLYETSRALDGKTRKVASGDFRAGIAADDSGVFWADAQSREVRHYIASEGKNVRLAAAQPSPAGISQDSDYIYFTTQWDGGVKRVLKAGGSVTTMARGNDRPTEIVVHDDFIYWLNEGDGSVMRISKLFDF